MRRKGEPIAGIVWESRKVFDDPDTRESGSKNARYYDHKFCEKVGATHVIPLMSDEKIIGTLHVSKKTRNSFSQADKEFLKDLGAIVSSALKSAETREAGRVIAKLSNALQSGTRRFVAGGRLDDLKQSVFKDFLQILNEVLNASRACLCFPTANGVRIVNFSDKSAEDNVLKDHTAFDALVKNGGFYLTLGADAPPPLVQLWPDELKEGQFALFQIRSKSQRFAYLAFVLDNKYVLSHSIARHIDSFLQRLGELIQLARQVKDAEIAIPLMLLGTRASVLQHKSREPFAILKGLAERFLDEPIIENTERSEIIDLMSQHTQRLDEILNQLTGLVEMATAPPTKFRVRDLLQPTIDQYKRDKIAVSLVIEGNDTASGRQDYLQIAFDFVLSNAKDAIRGVVGGKIIVRVWSEGGKPTIEITDNGRGMAEEVLDAALVPGFTTKEGTGLGLPSAYSIVASHGGVLELRSKIDQGTVCKVTLPEESMV